MIRPRSPYRLRRADSGEDGFTLIEVVIVVAVLGILSAIALLAVGNLSGNTSKASCQTAFRSVQDAIEAYKSEMGGYPNGVGGTAGLPATDSDLSTVNAAGATAGSGSELLVKGDTSPNTVLSAATSGPWLKTLPVSSGHYSIGVSNDGTGTVSVYSKSGALLGTSASSCPAT
jgi:prepilin-type N-terminal cleavage/methylation domain-containing protein